MKEYGNHYVVYVQESAHNYYELCPESRFKIYGVYESLLKARMGLIDCASVYEADYHERGKTVSSRIVDELDTVIIMKDWIINQHNGELMHCPKLTTIRIEREF